MTTAPKPGGSQRLLSAPGSAGGCCPGPGRTRPSSARQLRGGLPAGRRLLSSPCWWPVHTSHLALRVLGSSVPPLPAVLRCQLLSSPSQHICPSPLTQWTFPRNRRKAAGNARSEAERPPQWERGAVLAGTLPLACPPGRWGRDPGVWGPSLRAGGFTSERLLLLAAFLPSSPPPCSPPHPVLKWL